ncbi:hypothetical protein [Pedobacter aquatilis]|uniref:hypothetical protein n=1 Tax=Pedobacter aquatilis TaxID=351343 RepID=UPI0029316AD6|nr:hypothetical protein [Pedobacter aquatilis]
MNKEDNASDKVSEALTYESLTYMQKQKFDYLVKLINNEQMTLELVKRIEGRGRNSFNKVVEKIDSLNSAKQAEQNYHDALYDSFDVGKEYTYSEVISIVAQVRRDSGLPPYTSRWKQNCENDFFALFIVEDVYTADEDGSNKKQTGYRPVFKLKPED